jgi:hypothetical protein
MGPLTWWRTRLPSGARHLLAQSWPWIFAVSLVNGVFLFVGAIILVYVFSWGHEDLYLGSFFFAVVSVALAIVAGAAYDVQSRERGPVVRGE